MPGRRMKRVEDRETGEEFLKVVTPRRRVPNQRSSPLSI